MNKFLIFWRIFFYLIHCFMFRLTKYNTWHVFCFCSTFMNLWRRFWWMSTIMIRSYWNRFITIVIVGKLRRNINNEAGAPTPGIWDWRPHSQDVNSYMFSPDIAWQICIYTTLYFFVLLLKRFINCFCNQIEKNLCGMDESEMFMIYTDMWYLIRAFKFVEFWPQSIGSFVRCVLIVCIPYTLYSISFSSNSHTSFLQQSANCI